MENLFIYVLIVVVVGAIVYYILDLKDKSRLNKLDKESQEFQHRSVKKRQRLDNLNKEVKTSGRLYDKRKEEYEKLRTKYVNRKRHNRKS